MRFNMNDRVKVKLTDFGRHKLAEQDADLIATYPALAGKLNPINEDADGYSTWQLHHLMAKLGEYCVICCGDELPFDMNIEIIEPRI